MRRVIELAAPRLVAHWPERIRAVVLAAGEAPPPEWLKAFRARLRGTRVEVKVIPAFGYTSELKLDSKALALAASQGAMAVAVEVLRHGGLIWAHNLGLGRNLFLSRELGLICRACSVPLVSHHHDWWLENRWHHFAGLRAPGFRKISSVAAAILPSGRFIVHAAINQADAAVLQKHFSNHAGWLPNPAEPESPPPAGRVQAARAWLDAQLGEPAPVWLLPCRLLRRKNIAEALLLARWLRPQAWLVTTGGPSSAEEHPYAEALSAAAQANGWRLRLGVLHGDETGKPSVPELMAASEAVVLTSIQEGFGLPFLEAAAARRPLLARSLPNIAPDLAKFGFAFPQSYPELMVDPSLFDWPAEHARQTRLFASWKLLMPKATRTLAGLPALLAAGRQPRPVAFSRLTLTAQLEILAQPVEHSWDRCAPLNPFLELWRERAASGRLEASPWPRSAARWLGGQAYARRFLKLLMLDSYKQPRPNAAQAAQTEFLGKKLRAENLYPLLWNSRT